MKILVTDDSKMARKMVLKTLEDTLNFDSNDQLVSGTSKATYQYVDYSSYFSLYNDKKDDLSYTFDKKTFSYSKVGVLEVVSSKSLDEIIVSYSALGFACK